jgi:phosphopantothenoylcysteine synthetase/decarboxylase
MPAQALTLIVCGAPLAARAGDLATATVAAGWDTTVIGTPAARDWINDESIAAATGRSARYEYRAPTEVKSGPDADIVVVCPATFNTINKTVSGASDTYALGVIASALGTSTPVLMVPLVSAKLWGHPIWQDNVATLREWGVHFLDVQTGEPGTHPVASGTGPDVTAAFKPEWLIEALTSFD